MSASDQCLLQNCQYTHWALTTVCLAPRRPRRTCSNTATFSPMLPPGTMPLPPHKPAGISTQGHSTIRHHHPVQLAASPHQTLRRGTTWQGAAQALQSATQTISRSAAHKANFPFQWQYPPANVSSPKPPCPVLTCHDVCDQVAVQVWRDHDVKLVRPADQLHAGVVHNHLGVLDVGVLGSNSLARLRRESDSGGSINSSKSVAAVEQSALLLRP